MLYLWLLYRALCRFHDADHARVWSLYLVCTKCRVWTMPSCLATWFFLGALLQFTTIDVSNALKPTSPSDFTGPATGLFPGSPGFTASAMGIAEIFFQDNWVTGIVILIGIAINTRLSAL